MSQQPPPESQASLDTMWRQVWQKVRAICQEEIKKVFGANYTGGKLDGGAIGGTVPTTALPIATSSSLGAVEVGSGLAITSGGVLSATGTASLPDATTGAIGGVEVDVTPSSGHPIAITAAARTANTVLAGPTTGSAAAPTFRALVADDIPGGLASSLELTDGTTDLTGVGKITAVGLVVGGTSAAATLTAAGVGIDTDGANIPAVDFADQSGTLATPGAGHLKLYSVAGVLYTLNSSGVSAPVGSGGSGAVSYVPVTSGAEPMEFISDGAGHPVLVPVSV